MSEHTQASKYTIHPLSGFNEGLGFTILKQSDGEDTCHIAEVYGSYKEAKNLATLFASAPEMLEILKMVQKAWETSEVNFECNGEYVGTHHLIEKTLNLIAKVEGGAK